MVLPESVTLTYTAQLEGSSSILAAAMAAPPPPLDVFAFLGVQLVSDTVTTGVSTVTRVLVLSLAASSAATATATQDSNGHVNKATVTADGSGYGAVPITTISSGNTPIKKAKLKATLKVVGSTVVKGGAAYDTGDFSQIVVSGGLLPPTVNPLTGFFDASCIQGISIVAQGRNYSVNTAVQFANLRLGPGGREPVVTGILDGAGRLVQLVVEDAGSRLLEDPKPFLYDPGPASTGAGGGVGAKIAVQLGVGDEATYTATLDGSGGITSLTLLTEGGPYVDVPKIAVINVGGTGDGALLVPLMGVDSLEIVNAGEGYNGSEPTVSFADYFFYQFPTPESWTMALMNLMVESLSAATMGPVVASAPVFS